MWLHLLIRHRLVQSPRRRIGYRLLFDRLLVGLWTESHLLVEKGTATLLDQGCLVVMSILCVIEFLESLRVLICLLALVTHP